MVLIGAGLLILGTGIAMIVLPGPAILATLLGLSMLSGEDLWARRLLEMIRAARDRFSPRKVETGPAPAQPGD